MGIHLSPRVRSFKKRLAKYKLIKLICCLITCYVIYCRYPINIRSRNSDVLYSEMDLSSESQYPFHRGCADVATYINHPDYKKMNATFVMLVRNHELTDVLSTMNDIESHFNQWFKYPYVFLNDEPFTEEFKVTILKTTNAKVEFGLVDELDWEFPVDVREKMQYKVSLEDQGDRGILYGSMESYHKMCRFYSGMFFKHPMVKKYKWYWRIEPDVKFFCDISYDPFFEMEAHNKKYGFTVILPEIYWSVPNLFRYTKIFIKENSIKLGTLWKLFVTNFNLVETKDEEIKRWVHLRKDLEPKLVEKLAVEQVTQGDFENANALSFLIDKAQSKIPLFEDKFENEEYNLCHFWSNFEIARLDVFDNEIYDAYFRYLEENDGFWKERWGDAPIHSLGLALTLNIEDIHYFKDIGYQHSELIHCPRNSNQNLDVEYNPFEERFQRTGKQSKYDAPTDAGCGCRCQCPKKFVDIEDSGSFPCMDHWLELAHEMDQDKNIVDGKYVPSINADAMYEQIKKDFL